MRVSSSATVLLCSNSAEFARQGAAWLTGEGQICQAHSVHHALDRLLLDGSIVLVCIDADWLPTGATALVARLRALAVPMASELPIVIMAAPSSAPPETRELLAALDAGADAFVRMPAAGQAWRGLSSIPIADRLRRSEIVFEWTASRTENADPNIPVALAFTRLARDLRADDEWRRLDATRVSARLRCDPEQLLAPLNRLAKGLSQSCVRDSGHWQARLHDAVYRMPA